MSGDALQGNYSFTTIPEGVVSLDALAGAISSLQCNPRGVISIKMKQEYVGLTGLTLGQMYPLGSVLAVNSDLFGPCYLQSFSTEEATTVNSNDGFLKVSGFSGTVQEHFITGTSVSFFDMFSDSTFEIETLGENGIIGTAVRVLNVLESQSHEGNISFPTIPSIERLSKTVPIDHTFTHPLGFEFTVMGELKADASASRLKLKNKSGKKVSITYRLSAELKLNLDIIFKFNPGEWEREEELLHKFIPAFDIFRYGIPLPLRLFKVKLPPLKIALSLEMPFVTKGKAKANVELQIPAKLMVRTGKKVFDLSFDNGIDSVLSSSTAIEDNEELFSFEAPIAPIVQQSTAEFSIDVLFGLRPELMLQTPVISGEVRFIAGVNAIAETNLLAPFQSIDSKDDIFKNSACNDCHHVRLTLLAKVDQLEAEYSLPFNDESKTKSIPDVLNYSSEFAKFCFIEQLDQLKCTPTPAVSVSFTPSASATMASPIPVDTSSSPQPSNSMTQATFEISPSASPLMSASATTAELTSSPSHSTPPEDPLIIAACHSSSGRPLLRNGDGFSGGEENERVKALQMLLNRLDNAGLVVDGFFGSGTEGAVIAWQMKNSLSADGIVGSSTWDSLCV